MNSLFQTALNGLALIPETTRPLNTQFFHGKVFHSDSPDHCHLPDFVLPIGPSACLLAHMTIRRPVASALDLGTGCGIQSILAAEHTYAVTATDVNPRALALTRLNAHLNGVTNIETLQGSTFAPVHGQRFDLILANLPYVISPKTQFLYRDMISPRRTDSLNLLKQMPLFLSPGGFAHFNLSWVYKAGQLPWNPVKRSLQKAGLDAVLFIASDLSPEEYASMWAPSGKTNEWAGWYRAQGMERFAQGHLVLRARKPVENFFLIFRLDSQIMQDVGESVERLFQAQDQLEALERSGRWFSCVISRRGIQLRGEEADSVIASDSSGLDFKVRIHTAAAECVRRFNGALCVGEVLTMPAPEDVSMVLDELKLLIQFGMLEIK